MTVNVMDVINLLECALMLITAVLPKIPLFLSFFCIMCNFYYRELFNVKFCLSSGSSLTECEGNFKN